MVDLGSVFGAESTAGQLLIWGVGQQVIGAAIAPFLQSLANETWQVDPSVPVPPGTLADLVQRGLIDPGAGAAEAKKSGIGGDQFDKLVLAAETAPNLGTLIAGYQRQKLQLGDGTTANDSLLGGLKELGIDPKWWDLITELAVDWPSPADVMNALLEGQIDRPTALDWYVKGGGNPDWFQHDFDSKGSAPTPDMLNTMVNRGYIPVGGEGPDVTSFHQGFLEGPWRNKWETPMRQLGLYIPPPRTITALIHEGAVSDSQALAWFQDTGMSAETAAVYLKSAHSTKTSTAKALTVSNITALYNDKLITESEAETQLVALGYPATSAQELLKLADFNLAHAQITSAVNRIKALYTQRKINAGAAGKALAQLGQPAAQVSALIETWDIQLSADVKQLTEAQVVGAFVYEIMTQDEAMGNLEAIGYTAYDAWVLLSVRNQAPLPNKPAKVSGGGGIIP